MPRTLLTQMMTAATLGLAACSPASPEPPRPAAGDTGAPAVQAPTGNRAADAPRVATSPPTARSRDTTTASDAGLTFSLEQARRGRAVFRRSCTECHYSSEFRDRQFRFKWRRRTAGHLFGHIVSTMPEDAPGSLSLQEYVDVVAYILELNGFEPGAGELPPDEEALKALSLRALGASRRRN